MVIVAHTVQDPAVVSASGTEGRTSTGCRTETGVAGADIGRGRETGTVITAVVAVAVETGIVGTSTGG